MKQKTKTRAKNKHDVVVNTNITSFATKDDLQKEFRHLKHDLTFRIGVMIGIATAIIVWVEKIF